MGCHNFKFPQEGRRRNGGACARWTLHCSKAFLQRMHWGWRGVFRESAFGVACCRRGNLHRGNLVFVPPFRNWEGAQRSHVCFHRAKLAYVSVTSCVAVPQPFLFHFLPFVFELPSCTILLFLSCSIPCDFCCPFFFEGTSVVVHFDAQQKVAQKIVLPSFSFSFSFFYFTLYMAVISQLYIRNLNELQRQLTLRSVHISRVPFCFHPCPMYCCASLHFQFILHPPLLFVPFTHLLFLVVFVVLWAESFTGQQVTDMSWQQHAKSTYQLPCGRQRAKNMFRPPCAGVLENVVTIR